jgi:hypothetical protein
MVDLNHGRVTPVVAAGLSQRHQAEQEQKGQSTHA